MNIHIFRCMHHTDKGFTVLEVVVSIFIFGCVSTALLTFITQIERIRGRAIYLENATRVAADEAQRLRNSAAQNSMFEDSSYSQRISGILYNVHRHVLTNKHALSYEIRARAPVQIELRISTENRQFPPLLFNLLIGSDHP